MHLRKEVQFDRTPKYEQVFSLLKASLFKLSFLSRPSIQETLFFYVFLFGEGVSIILAIEVSCNENLISMEIFGLEKSYKKINKITFALVIASRKLQHYIFYVYDIGLDIPVIKIDPL